jgi:Helix-turn-helix
MNRISRSYASHAPDFSGRLRQVVAEFGSRNALAKASGIAASTLQGYEAGAKPGMDALERIARIGNVDLNWLVTDRGEIRPPGLIPGAALADILMVSQYELGTALGMSVIIGQVPFSRYALETRLNLKQPSYDTLLVVQAAWDLYEISRGDLVLIDRSQKNLARDGIYLLDLPGITLRAIWRCVGDELRVIGPEHDPTASSAPQAPGSRRRLTGVQEVKRSELLGDERQTAGKVVGRVVWISRGI